MLKFLSKIKFSKKQIGYFVLFLVLSFSSYLIFKDLSWCCGDDAQLSSILFDKEFLFGWRGHGRFWPLGLFDYNILRLFPDFRSPVPCYLYNAIILIVSLCLWYKVLNIVNKNNYLLSSLGVLLLSSSTAFFQIHMECFFPEHFMFFTLTLFLFFYLKGIHTQQAIYYFIAIISAVYTTYCKEPAFVIFLIFSATNLIFEDKLTKKDKTFNLLLLVNSVVYVLIYAYLYCFSEGFSKNIYGEAVKGSNPLLKGKTIFNSPMTVFYVLELFVEKVEPIFGLLFLLGLIRAYFVLVRKDRKNLFSDALLFGANGYAFSYIFIFFPNTWYLFPEMVLGIPVLIYWIEKNKKTATLLAISSVILAYFSGNISKDITGRKLRERKRCKQFFENVISEYHNGKDLILFGSKGYTFNGINFCVNTSLQNEMNIVKSIQQIEDVPENSLVFVMKNNKKRNLELENRDFKLIKSFWRINLFAKKTSLYFE